MLPKTTNLHLNNIVAAAKLLDDNDILSVTSNSDGVTIWASSGIHFAEYLWNSEDSKAILQLDYLWISLLPRVKQKIKSDFLDNAVKKEMARLKIYKID